MIKRNVHLFVFRKKFGSQVTLLNIIGMRLHQKSKKCIVITCKMTYKIVVLFVDITCDTRLVLNFLKLYDRLHF